jgi:transketolase
VEQARQHRLQGSDSADGNSANVLKLKKLNLEAELESTKQKLGWSESTAERSTQELKDAESTHRTELGTDRENHYDHLKEIRVKHAREQEVALSKLKVRYTQQIDDANAKLRLHKRTMVQNEELQKMIYNLEREKSNLVVAKAAVEKRLQDLKNEVVELRSYKPGYKQIESGRNDFERKYNDNERRTRRPSPCS